MITRRRILQGGCASVAGLALGVTLPAEEARPTPAGRRRLRPRHALPDEVHGDLLRIALTDDYNPCLLIGDTVSVFAILVRWVDSRPGHDIGFFYHQDLPDASQRPLHARLRDDAGTVMAEETLRLPSLRVVTHPTFGQSTLSDMVTWHCRALTKTCRTLELRFIPAPGTGR